MKFSTSLSTLFPSAIVATSLVSASSAMPIESRQAQCSEAARFGIFNVTPTQNLKIGDTVTITYTQNCPQLQNVYPSTFSLDIGGSGSQAGTPFVQVTPSQPYPGVGKTLEFTATVPDFYLSGFYKGNELAFYATIEYSNQGPEGTNATLYYTDELAFTFDRPSTDS